MTFLFKLAASLESDVLLFNTPGLSCKIVCHNINSGYDKDRDMDLSLV